MEPEERPHADDQIPSQPATTGVEGSGDLRLVAVYSLIAGACPLIPVPILDDWILDRVRRRLVQRLALSREIRLPSASLIRLADREVSDWSADGCVKGCLRQAVVTPIRFVYRQIVRKLFRKILFVLAIKDAVDEFSVTFHHAWLLRHAFENGPPLDGFEAARRLRADVDEVRRGLDPRPLESAVRSAFRHSRRLLRRAARWLRLLARKVRRRGPETTDLDWVDVAAAQAEAEAGGLVDELIAGLVRQRDYLGAIEQRLDARRGSEVGARQGLS